jgi:hypothetical protein
MTVIFFKKFVTSVRGARKPSYATVLHNQNRENKNYIENFDWEDYQKGAIWKIRRR